MLFSFFEWSEATWLGTTVRESVWLFAVIEAGHLLGLCVLGGALLIVDLRMLGLGLTGRPVAQLARDARPWLLGGIAAMILTGIPLFLSEAVKLYWIGSFRWKAALLPLALVFTLSVRERAVRSPGAGDSLRARLVAATSLALWLGVAAAGRWIGFS